MLCVSKRSLASLTGQARMAESESTLRNSKALGAANTVIQGVNMMGGQGHSNVNGCVLQGSLSLVFETCRYCNNILKWLEPVRQPDFFFFFFFSHYHHLQATGFYHTIILFLDLLITFSNPLLFTIKLWGEKFKVLPTPVDVALKKLTNTDTLLGTTG